VVSRLDQVEPLELPSIRDDVRERRPRSAFTASTVVGVVIAAVLALLALTVADEVPAGRVLGVVLVGAWCAAALFVAVHHPREPLGSLMALAAFAGAVALFGAALAAPRQSATSHDWGEVIRAFAVAALPAVGLHIALGVPDGFLRTRPRRVAPAAGYAAAIGLGLWLLDRRPDVPIAPIAIFTGAYALVAIVGYLARCRKARSAHERARLQWIAWAVVVAATMSIVALVLHALVDWPGAVRGVAVSTTLLVPLALALGASERIAVRIDRLLVHTITLAGLAAMVAACYLLIVLGLGREPTGDEKTLLGLSMVAAALAALLWLPVRERLTDVATRRVYGERHAPDEVLRSFGSRLKRALPIDEVL